MPDEPIYPFTAFNFSVEIAIPDISVSKLCQASFSECDGLEMTMDVKTIREGGNNGKQIRFAGPMSYASLTLKRGMTTDDFDLWKWFSEVQRNPTLRADAEIVLLSANHEPRVHFKLERCLPIKLKAPPLNAKDGMVAVEELQLAYESLSIEPA